MDIIRAGINSHMGELNMAHSGMHRMVLPALMVQR
jgi:hypothetical protein